MGNAAGKQERQYKRPPRPEGGRDQPRQKAKPSQLSPEKAARLATFVDPRRPTLPSISQESGHHERAKDVSLVKSGKDVQRRRTDLVYQEDKQKQDTAMRAQPITKETSAKMKNQDGQFLKFPR
jgi:hypothetical protein